MSRKAAEIVREYGPFPGADSVHGVTYDGQNVWFAAGDKLNAFHPASGKMLRSIDVAAHAGTAFDGKWNAAASRNDSVERHQIVEIVELEGTNLLDHGRETPPRTAAALSGPVRRRS